MVHIGLFLKKIYFKRKSGQLSFRRGDTQKQLCFQDGGLIFAKTNIPEERIGAILRQIGKISAEVFQSIPEMIHPGNMLGETLIQKKIISQKDLYEGLVVQMTKATLSLFTFFDAEITFSERGRFFEDGLEQKMNLLQLIEQGVREMPFHPALKNYLENKIPVRGDPEHIQILTNEEKALLDLLDGEKSSGKLQTLQTRQPENFWKTLYLMFCLNIIDLQEMGKKREEEEDRVRTDADIRERIQEALEFKKKLPELDHYQVLGVPSHADEEEIKKAYFGLARKFHPDLFGRHLAAEYKSQLEEVFTFITRAYRALLSKEPNTPFAKTPASVPREGEKDRSKNAETRFRQGKTLFDRGHYEAAISLLEDAIRLKSDKGDYYLLLALAQSKISTFSKKAEHNFLHSLELEPWNPEGYVGLGFLYKHEGLLARAKKQFEKALEIDPEHEIAKQTLRRVFGKDDKKKGLKGILTKDLFGSKKK